MTWVIYATALLFVSDGYVREDQVRIGDTFGSQSACVAAIPETIERFQSIANLSHGRYRFTIRDSVCQPVGERSRD